eukprot:203436_1
MSTSDMQSPTPTDDSDSFAMINADNAPSPPPGYVDNHGDKNTIANIKDCDSTDEFEHLAMPHVDCSSNNTTDSGEYQYHPIQVLNQTEIEGNVLPIASESPKSISSTPNATVEDIIHLTEPLNTDALSPVSALSMEGTETMQMYQENEPFIKKTKLFDYHEYEYQHFIADKSAHNQYLCCRMTSDENIERIRTFLQNVSSVVCTVCNYVDKCFGGDAFIADTEVRRRTLRKM